MKKKEKIGRNMKKASNPVSWDIILLFITMSHPHRVSTHHAKRGGIEEKQKYKKEKKEVTRE